MVGLRTRDFSPGVGEGQACTCCERPLYPDKIVWLELDQRTYRYVDPTRVTVPPEQSQGCFPFGDTCARKVLKTARTYPE